MRSASEVGFSGNGEVLPRLSCAGEHLLKKPLPTRLLRKALKLRLLGQTHLTHPRSSPASTLPAHVLGRGVLQRFLRNMLSIRASVTAWQQSFGAIDAAGSQSLSKCGLGRPLEFAGRRHVVYLGIGARTSSFRAHQLSECICHIRCLSSSA